MRHPDTGLAYLFWLVSFAGISGLHRFYLGKPLSGFLYFITVGFFGIGTIVDGFRMPELVRRARLERRIDQLLEAEERLSRPTQLLDQAAGNRQVPGHSRRRGLDHAILTYALENHGIVTPSRVALAAESTPETVREHLERLVVQGFANATVSRDGAMLYVFPEFLDEQGRGQLGVD